MVGIEGGGKREGKESEKYFGVHIRASSTQTVTTARHLHLLLLPAYLLIGSTLVPQGQVFETINKHYSDFALAYRDASEVNTELKTVVADINTLQTKIKVCRVDKSDK